MRFALRSPVADLRPCVGPRYFAFSAAIFRSNRRERSNFIALALFLVPATSSQRPHFIHYQPGRLVMIWTAESWCSHPVPRAGARQRVISRSSVVFDVHLLGPRAARRPWCGCGIAPGLISVPGRALARGDAAFLRIWSRLVNLVPVRLE